MPGRRTPGSRRTWRSEAASIAPVFPAETTASASPSPTALTARTSDESGFARTASAGFSCISIASAHGDELEPLRVERRRPEEDRRDRLGGRRDGARDDLDRRVVAAERVDRDADRHGSGARSTEPAPAAA